MAAMQAKGPLNTHTLPFQLTQISFISGSSIDSYGIASVSLKQPVFQESESPLFLILILFTVCNAETLLGK